MPNVWESRSSRQFIKGLITGTFHSVHACPVIKHHDWVFSPIAELGEWHLASRQRDNMSELLLQCKKLNILSTWRQKLCCLIVYSTYSHRATRNTYFAFWLWRDSFSDSPALLTIMYSTLSTVQYNEYSTVQCFFPSKYVSHHHGIQQDFVSAANISICTFPGAMEFFVLHEALCFLSPCMM